MNRDYYKYYHFLELNHWWHQARLKILENILKNYVTANLKILNIGSCTGETSLMLNRFGKVTSLEYDEETYNYLSINKKINAVRGDAQKLDFKNDQFDLICCFDVLEHIEDDSQALREIRRCLKLNGLLFLSVPSYKFLWSNHDVQMHHYRRYSSREICSLIINAKLNIVRSSYFNIFLLVPIIIFRSIKKLFKIKSGNDYSIPPYIINKILFYVFYSESYLLKIFNLPFGVSNFVLAKK